jgi:2-oxoisovalerate dehydrogenase E1 component
MQFNRHQYTNEALIHLYRQLLLPRMIEEKMLVLLRQGKISKWFSGIGQEAISVGATHALQSDEWIMPLHRNLGVFTGRGMPLHKLFQQWQGHKEGYSKGRERSFHFGSREHHICGMISHLGPQLALADGAALAHVLKNEKRIALAFSGDGGTSEGDFHEALNVAAVWDLPVIFGIENNAWGLSTPSNEQFKCKQFIDKGIGYGMDAIQVDGNNILEVIETVRNIRAQIQENPRPFILELMTFRMRGHEEASGTKYYPEGLQAEWEPKDPVTNFEAFLLEQNILDQAAIDQIKHQFKEEIQEAFDAANAAPKIVPSLTQELADVYAPHAYVAVEPGSNSEEVRFIDAIQDGLRTAMQTHHNLVLMGQDIAEYGGAFKVTEGFVELFGKDRVRNTPLCESAIIGAGLGLSIAGMKAMVEMQFADFVSVGFNQIVNNLAKLHWRWGQNADLVVRMPTGAGTAAGPFHSQSNEAWFAHTPGLKVVYPSNPHDAKGLLLAAFEDPNPVLFFEHKFLYRSLKGNVPVGYYNTPIGKAASVQHGTDLTIITYGLGVHWALDAAAHRPQHTFEILDLRTLLPLDLEAIIAAASITGRVLVLHEDTITAGIGGEIVALVNEHCFEHLDAPVLRVASLDTPVPFAADLEQQFLAQNRLLPTIDKLLSY